MMNMEEFKINLSSLNEGEVCKLLLDALNLTNSKCIDLSNEVAKLKEKLDRAELDKTKLSLEKDGEIKVLLDSNMAFGTGEHETTSMVLEKLQRYWPPLWRWWQ